MFKHHLPQTVLSPRDCVSDVQVLYDGGAIPGEYAVARLDWNGQPTLGFAGILRRGKPATQIK